MKRATRDWLKKAEADWLAALDLSRRRKLALPDQVCFHCEQCAEKYVKARLEEANVRIPRTHDLGELLKLALPYEPLWSALQPALQNLSNYAVAYRYPGHEASKAEVKTALMQCKAVRKEVRLSFGLKV